MIQKNALLFGVSSGVGLATAQELVARGFTVYATSSQTNIELANCTILPLNLAHSQTYEAFWDKIKDISFDVCIFNSGKGEIGSVESMSQSEIQDIWNINYFGFVYFVQKLLPSLRAKKSGHLLFLGSITSRIYFPFKAQYSASKSALTAFALSLAQEVSPLNIRVSVLEPGWIRSEFHNQLQARNDLPCYSQRFAPFLNKKNDLNSKYPSGKEVAQIILKCILGQETRLRIPVGPDAKAIWTIRFLLDSRFANWLLKLYLNKH
jgi:short-subunit dehydrogenase